MAEALREELLAVPGIAGAEVESDQGVAGVRVQLAVGADPDEVGAAVRRILAQHGMRPAITEPREVGGDVPPPPPGAPGSVVSFPLVGEHAIAQEDAEPDSAVERLESVSVEETPDGISIAVRSTSGTRAGGTLEDGVVGIDAAIVAAVAELTENAPVSLVDISEIRLGEQVVITVLLALREGDQVSGSAIQSGGRAYAVARATWVALTARA